ncbi:hypothetical protein [Hyphococcus sp. DH-69]|uniref:hypothetical protein n=1 Tax=Hyphococcus formosus TaxID=3143534 RepID=UPI00398B545E
MTSGKSRNQKARKLSLAAAAVAMVFGAGATSMAGSSVSVGYSSGYYGGGGYYNAGYSNYHRGHYRGHRHHRHHRRHHRHGGGGGKAAAIALGVIGGAIILNELAEDRAEARARDRYYDDRYRRDAYRYDPYYEDRYDDDRYADRRYDDEPLDDRYDDELAGGNDERRYSGSPDAAYQVCLDQARGALAERGFVITAPYRPDTVEDRGGSWMMTATVTAQRGGDRWARAMSCEASESRVYRMELI